MPMEQTTLDKMMDIYREAAGKALSSIMKSSVAIDEPEGKVMELEKVEYLLLEPALFVKSCLTSQVAGTVMLVFRQRDIQIFLNKLMGIDELASPDFVFDDIALSAAKEIMNQFLSSATDAAAKYLGSTMESSDCEISLSDGTGNLAPVMGEEPDKQVNVMSYKMNIDGMIESEFMQVFSEEAMESIQQEIAAKEEKEKRQEEEEVKEREQIRLQAAKATKEPIGYSDQDMGLYTRAASSYQGKNIDLIMNVPLNVTVEIGRAKRKLKEVLGFDNGTVVELEKQADAPVDIIANGQLIARGNVVVIDDNFGVRITEIVNKKNIFGNGEIS